MIKGLRLYVYYFRLIVKLRSRFCTAFEMSLFSATSLSLESFITHIFPRSFAEAMANNEILQILVFSIFFGSALAYVQHHSEATVIGK